MFCLQSIYVLKSKVPGFVFKRPWFSEKGGCVITFHSEAPDINV